MQYITQDTSSIEIFTTKNEKKTISVSEWISFNYLVILQDNAQVDFDIRCSGVHSQATIKVLCIWQNNHRITSNIITILEANHAQANVYILSLLKDGSDLNVHGNITLAPDVSKVSWHLLEENIILWDKIKIRTAPILDVRSSDVSASHGCRVEKLDPKRLFYMQSRGLTPSGSQSLILDGYLNAMFEWFDVPENIIENIKKQIL
jgi:Fe-S cluster assembly protein SufD